MFWKECWQFWWRHLGGSWNLQLLFLKNNENFANCLFLQVDPRCHIQSLYWYHEGPSGESRLLKTGRNATEPYIHTINSAYDHHQGRYYCRIQNVMGINECSAYLIIRNSAVKTEHQCQYSVLIPILAFLHWMRWGNVSAKAKNAEISAYMATEA